VDLEHLVELVEEVDERGAQVGLQRVEDALRSTCRDSALVRSMFRYTWGLRVLKVAARPRRPGLAFPFWTSSAVLRESSLRPRLRRSSTIIWKPPVWPRPRMGGGITTKASASWIPERS